MFHALVLNLHQPSGNLEFLLNHQPWEAEQILYAMDRIPRFLWNYQDVGRVHLSLSGTLLEVLSNPAFQRRVYGTVDCGSLLWYLQNQSIIDILGTGYYHPVFPLIPPADWPEQLKRWQGIGKQLFWRPQFSGFWPPEMGFSMEMIPLLAHMGYRYVLVDSAHVEPVGRMSWPELRYRPHVARYGDAQIIVVVRDRELSDAQESGMEYAWFKSEVEERTRWCDFPPLVTTATDGENGGWFRDSSMQANFWGVFAAPMLESARQNPKAVRPIFIHEYLDRYGAQGEVTVRSGAWNTGWHNGVDFTQWRGSPQQQDALARVATVSGRFHALQDQAQSALEMSDPSPFLAEMSQAHWRLLHAQTSCHFYWGWDWLPLAHADLDLVEQHLEQARTLLAG
ncbi:MAG: hypothetical protein H7831_07180 [Magnetococcus sp. WYHC-3]